MFHMKSCVPGINCTVEAEEGLYLEGGPGKAFHGVAGTKRDDGYYSVAINNKRYLVHRVVWVLFHYKIDRTLVIDHIDRNPSNNFIDNLRLVTQGENNKNKGSYRVK